LYFNHNIRNLATSQGLRGTILLVLSHCIIPISLLIVLTSNIVIQSNHEII